MSEAEMDAHTIRSMREQSVADGQPPKDLVSLNPSDPLKAVIDKLFQNRCSVAPVLTRDAHGKAEACSLLLQNGYMTLPMRTSMGHIWESALLIVM